MPAPVSAWPPAYGWWLVAACALMLVAGLLFYFWRRHRRQAPLRAALKQLQVLSQQQNDSQFLSDCAHWMKRMAISLHGREHTAALHGESWLSFLDASGATTEFSHGAGRALTAIYQARCDVDRAALLRVMHAWLQQQFQTRKEVDPRV